MALFTINPETNLPDVQIDEQAQLQKYLADIALNDLKLTGGKRRERPDGLMAKYKVVAYTPEHEKYVVEGERAVGDVFEVTSNTASDPDIKV